MRFIGPIQEEKEEKSRYVNELHEAVHDYCLFDLPQLTEKVYKNLDNMTRMLRYSFPFPIFAYPFYLVRPSFSFSRMTALFYSSF